MREIDYYINVLLDNIERVSRGADENKDEISSLEHFSQYLYRVYVYLRIYLKYKAAITVSKDSKVYEAEKAIDAIQFVGVEDLCDWDVSILARNWFAGKINNLDHSFLGKL